MLLNLELNLHKISSKWTKNHQIAILVINFKKIPSAEKFISCCFWAFQTFNFATKKTRSSSEQYFYFFLTKTWFRPLHGGQSAPHLRKRTFNASFFVVFLRIPVFSSWFDELFKICNFSFFQAIIVFASEVPAKIGWKRVQAKLFDQNGR